MPGKRHTTIKVLQTGQLWFLKSSRYVSSLIPKKDASLKYNHMKTNMKIKAPMISMYDQIPLHPNLRNKGLSCFPASKHKTRMKKADSPWAPKSKYGELMSNRCPNNPNAPLMASRTTQSPMAGAIHCQGDFCSPSCGAPGELLWATCDMELPHCPQNRAFPSSAAPHRGHTLWKGEFSEVAWFN